MGCLFLIFAQYKVFGTKFTMGGGFENWIHEFIKDGAYPFMVPILQHFVLDHSSVKLPWPNAVFWEYFGASLDHLVLAFCFAAFLLGDAETRQSLQGPARDCESPRLGDGRLSLCFD